jgi:hypothetical protein
MHSAGYGAPLQLAESGATWLTCVTAREPTGLFWLLDGAAAGAATAEDATAGAAGGGADDGLDDLEVVAGAAGAGGGVVIVAAGAGGGGGGGAATEEVAAAAAALVVDGKRSVKISPVEEAAAAIEAVALDPGVSVTVTYSMTVVSTYRMPFETKSRGTRRPGLGRARTVDERAKRTATCWKCMVFVKDREMLCIQVSRTLCKMPSLKFTEL